MTAETKFYNSLRNFILKTIKPLLPVLNCFSEATALDQTFHVAVQSKGVLNTFCVLFSDFDQNSKHIYVF